MSCRRYACLATFLLRRWGHWQNMISRKLSSRTAVRGGRDLKSVSSAGSTTGAALYGNKAGSLCIDNWSQFGGPKAKFVANIESIRSADLDFSFVERDFRAVDYASIGTFNVYLFDGPHSERDQYDG